MNLNDLLFNQENLNSVGRKSLTS